MEVINFIHPDAKIGKNVEVGHFSVIEADVEIGDGTIVGPNATIMNGARIGKNCRIFPGAVISAIPQDLKYNNERTIVEIGDNTTIRECVTIHKGTHDKHKTVVGKNCLIMAYVHIAHDASIGDFCIIANSAGIAGHVVIDDHVIIEGGGVSIQQFLHIGRYVFIAGGSGVRKNIPPYIKVARDPLSFAGVNTIGLKRNGFDEKTIKELQDIYRLIFVQNTTIVNGIKKVEENFPESKVKDEVLSFIASSKNGIVKRLIE